MSREIVVYKARRQLEIWENGARLKAFSVGIGKNALGTKEREGDGRTPEGEYRIVVKNPKSAFHLSLGLSYPNPADADRGLRAGLITPEEHRAILDAHARGQRPPWKTALGGEIFLHGNLEKKGTTRGCISLYDADMTELYALASLGDRVVIRE